MSRKTAGRRGGKPPREASTTDGEVARAFLVGCRDGNLDILLMLPTDVQTVMRKLRITKMPANRRVNDLMSVGLLKREIGTGRLLPTPLTAEVLDALDGVAKARRRRNV